MKQFVFALSIVFVLITATSCIYQKQGPLHSIKQDRRLFIAMPQSPFVFENIAPQLQALCVKHFRRLGYYLVDTKQKSHYSLACTINNLSYVRRYISPDVLLFHYSLRLELTCYLYDSQNKLIKEKKFTVCTLVSKAKNPILNSSFFVYESNKLLVQVAMQIEVYFRKCLLG